MLLSRWRIDGASVGESRSWALAVWLGAGLAGTALFTVGSVLWMQYSPLTQRGLPKADLGFPFFGHTLAILKKGIEPWSRDLRRKHAPFRALHAFYLFQPTILLSNDVYKEHVQKLDNDGELVTLFPPGMNKIIGDHSLIILPAGKSQPTHRRIRSKCIRALAPKQVLGQLEMIQLAVREELRSLADASAAGGRGRAVPAAEHLAFTVSARLILGTEFSGHLEQIRGLFTTIANGLLMVPINLGRFTANGRAHLARAELMQVLSGMLEEPAVQRTALGELLLACEEGAALTTEEILDSVLTMLIAGQLTTKDAIPRLMVDLSEHPEEYAKIRAEASRGFASIVEDSATLRFLMESLRRNAPAAAIRRVCYSQAIDLGADGIVPKGFPMALFLEDNAEGPIRTDRALFEDGKAMRTQLQHAFGGDQPHACVGKDLALLEMQVFLRELCGSYDLTVFEAIYQPAGVFAGWRGDLPVKLTAR